MALPYAKIILDRLKEELKPRGFKKNGQTFVKAVNDCYQFVNLQASQFGGAGRQDYTLNLAVFCDGFAVAEEADKKPSWAGGQWRARLGDFTRESRDTWWIVTDDDEARTAAEEMAEVLVLAFEVLDAMASYEAILHFKTDRGKGSFPGGLWLPPVNKVRAREGLPPVAQLPKDADWRDAWHRGRFPNAAQPVYPLKSLGQIAPAQDAPVEGAN